MRLRQALLGSALLGSALLLGTSGIALAERASGFDPAQLPAIHGTVAEYSLTPRGDVDGIILKDGTEVHLPPRLGTELVYAVQPGAPVTVHGLKALAVPVVQAMSVTNDATGKTVVDSGPPGPGGRPHGRRGPAAAGRSLTAQGTVKMALYGPRGDLNGVMLEDGTQIHLPPPEAARLAAWLKPGQPIYAQGNGSASALGRVIGARLIGPNAEQAIVVARPPPPPGAVPPPGFGPPLPSAQPGQ